MEGEESLAIVTGYKSKAKGAIGCWLVLTERNENMKIMCVKAVEVDGETIKPNIFYTLINGEVVEAD